MIDLTKALLERYGTRKPREIGRYWTSELYAVTHGWITPKDFLNPPKKRLLQCFQMWQGVGKHKQVQELLEVMGYVCEPKIEHHGDGWVLVGKADALRQDHGLEIKTSDIVHEKAHASAVYQAKILCSLFNVPVMYVVQPITVEGHVKLKQTGIAKRSDDWFGEQTVKLDLFHKELVHYGQSIS